MERDWLCTNIQHIPRCRLGGKEEFLIVVNGDARKSGDAAKVPPRPIARCCMGSLLNRVHLEHHPSIHFPLCFYFRAYSTYICSMEALARRRVRGEVALCSLWVVVTLV